VEKAGPRQVSKVGPCRQNVTARQRKDYARRQVLDRVGHGKFRHSGASEGLSVNNSVRRRLSAHGNKDNVAEVSRSLRQVVEDLRMKPATRKKKRRVIMINRHHSAVARLPQRRAARDRDNRGVERENRKEEHHRQSHDSLREVVPATKASL
jgi:hypothetical protein